MTESRLEVALRHVVAGRRIVAAQERRVAERQMDGRNCSDAESLLATYRMTQEIFEESLRAAQAEAKDLHAFP